MAAPRVTIPELPEQDALVDTDLLVVQNGTTTKRLTVGHLMTQNNTALEAHITNPIGAHPASAISADPSLPTLAGIDVQSQLAQAASAISLLQTSSGTAETGLAAHIANLDGAHPAEAISVAAIPGVLADDVQDALSELFEVLDGLGVDLSDLNTALLNHLNDTSAAHAASAISVLPAGTLAATDVQAALTELQFEIDGLAATSGGGGVPPGGSAGHVLSKLSDDEGDADWVDQFGTTTTPRNLDGDTGQFANLTIVEDGTPTSTWPERLRVNFNNGTRTRRTFYLNEYGEARCIPARDDTIPLRIFAQEFAADGIRDTSVPLFEIQDNRDDRNVFATINNEGRAWFGGGLAVDGHLLFAPDALASVQEGTVLEAGDPAPGVGVWLRKLDFTPPPTPTINAQTGTTYVPVIADAGVMVTLSNASAITVTLPSNATVGYTVGAEVDFLWLGVGQPSFVAGSGATVNGTPGLKLRARYSACTAKKVATNDWVILGDLAA